MSSSAAPSSLARRVGAARSVAARYGRRGLALARRTPFPRPTVRGWTLLAVGIGLVGGGLVGSTSVAVSAGLLLFAGANAHLFYVAVQSQPDCVQHVKGAGDGNGYRAAQSAC